MGRILEMEWPELKIKVEAEPLPFNQEFYDFFLDNCPLKGIQSHAVVSGQILYIMNLRFTKYPDKRYMDLQMEDLMEEPVGRISIFLTAGKTGSVMAKYGYVNEPMSYPSIAQVVEKDMEKLKEAGRAEWESIYRNKQIISVVYTAK